MAELRKRGLVTAVIYSGPFLKLGKAQARTFGVPELPLLEITQLHVSSAPTKVTSAATSTGA